MKLDTIKTEPNDDFDEFVQEAVKLEQPDDLFVPRYPQAEADRIMELISEQIDERIAHATAHYQQQINDLKRDLQKKEAEICDLTKTVADLEDEYTYNHGEVASQFENLEDRCEKIETQMDEFCVDIENSENVVNDLVEKEEETKSSIEKIKKIENHNNTELLNLIKQSNVEMLTNYQHLEDVFRESDGFCSMRISELEEKTKKDSDELWDVIADVREDCMHDFETMCKTKDNVEKLIVDLKNLEERLTNVVTHLQEVDDVGDLKDCVDTLRSVVSKDSLKISVLNERVDYLESIDVDKDMKMGDVVGQLEKLEKKIYKTRRVHGGRISQVEKDADTALKILATF